MTYKLLDALQTLCDKLGFHKWAYQLDLHLFKMDVKSVMNRGKL